MRRVLLLALAALAVASMALAQEPWIGLYTDDPGFSDCNLEDIAPGLCAVHMVQGNLQAISCEFRIDDTNKGTIGDPLGINWTVPVTIITPGETVFSQGVSAGYGACTASPVKVGTISYFCSGTSPTCSSLEVVGHGLTGNATVADCSLPSPNIFIAMTQNLTINGDGSCLCGVPTEEASWGQIKALYSE